VSLAGEKRLLDIVELTTSAPDLSSEYLSSVGQFCRSIIFGDVTGGSTFKASPPQTVGHQSDDRTQKFR